MDNNVMWILLAASCVFDLTWVLAWGIWGFKNCLKGNSIGLIGAFLSLNLVGLFIGIIIINSKKQELNLAKFIKEFATNNNTTTKQED